MRGIARIVSSCSRGLSHIAFQHKERLVADSECAQRLNSIRNINIIVAPQSLQIAAVECVNLFLIGDGFRAAHTILPRIRNFPVVPDALLPVQLREPGAQQLVHARRGDALPAQTRNVLVRLPLPPLRLRLLRLLRSLLRGLLRPMLRFFLRRIVAALHQVREIIAVHLRCRLRDLRAGDLRLFRDVRLVRSVRATVHVGVAVRQHIVQHELHALRRGVVLLPIVVDDVVERLADTLIAEAPGVEQIRDAVARLALHAGESDGARQILGKVLDRKALTPLRVGKLLLHRLCRLDEIGVQPRVVELERHHIALADVGPVPVIDVVFRRAEGVADLAILLPKRLLLVRRPKPLQLVQLRDEAFCLLHRRDVFELLDLLLIDPLRLLPRILRRGSFRVVLCRVDVHSGIFRDVLYHARITRRAFVCAFRAFVCYVFRRRSGLLPRNIDIFRGSLPVDVSRRVHLGETALVKAPRRFEELALRRALLRLLAAHLRKNAVQPVQNAPRRRRMRNGLSPSRRKPEKTEKAHRQSRWAKTLFQPLQKLISAAQNGPVRCEGERRRGVPKGQPANLADFLLLRRHVHGRRTGEEKHHGLPMSLAGAVLSGFPEASHELNLKPGLLADLPCGGLSFGLLALDVALAERGMRPLPHPLNKVKAAPVPLCKNYCAAAFFIDHKQTLSSEARHDRAFANTLCLFYNSKTATISSPHISPFSTKPNFR